MAESKQVTEMPTEKLDELIARIERIEKRIVSDDDIMTVEDVATKLQLHPVTVRNIKHLIGFSKIGSDIKFKRSDVDAYLQRHYTPSTETNNSQGVKRVARLRSS